MPDVEKIRKITPERFPSIMHETAREKPKKVFPKFRLDLKHIPEAKKWKVGTDYGILLRVEQVGIINTEFDKSVEFKITGTGDGITVFKVRWEGPNRQVTCSIEVTVAG